MEDKLKDIIANLDDYLYKFGQWFSKMVNTFVNAYKSNNLEKPLVILSFVWVALAICVVLYIFIRFDLEHVVHIDKNKSIDFPDNPDPAKLEFCIDGKITIKSFLATIMMLFYKKSLVFTKEAVATGTGDHLVIKKNELQLTESLTLNEERFEKKLLLGMGQNNEIPFNKIRDIMKHPDAMQDLVNIFTEWNYYEKTGIRLNDYYENIGAALTGVYLFLILGVIIFILTLKYNKIVIAFFFLFALIVYYMYHVSKRTYKCNEERAKWLMFKKNLSQMRKLNLKDMPDPKIWGKYYAYSLVLGNEKEMYRLFIAKETKTTNMEDENSYDDYFQLMRDAKKVCTNFKYAYNIAKKSKRPNIKL